MLFVCQKFSNFSAVARFAMSLSSLLPYDIAMTLCRSTSDIPISIESAHQSYHSVLSQLSTLSDLTRDPLAAASAFEQQLCQQCLQFLSSPQARSIAAYTHQRWQQILVPASKLLTLVDLVQFLTSNFRACPAAPSAPSSAFNFSSLSFGPKFGTCAVGMPTDGHIIIHTFFLWCNGSQPDFYRLHYSTLHQCLHSKSTQQRCSIISCRPWSSHTTSPPMWIISSGSNIAYVPLCGQMHAWYALHMFLLVNKPNFIRLNEIFH